MRSPIPVILNETKDPRPPSIPNNENMLIIIFANLLPFHKNIAIRPDIIAKKIVMVPIIFKNVESCVGMTSGREDGCI